MSLQIVLFDKAGWRRNLLPLVATRPVGNLRVGILTLDQKWQKLFGAAVYYFTESHLQQFYSPPDVSQEDFLVIRADYLPSLVLVSAIKSLVNGQCLMHADNWVAFRTTDISVLNNRDAVQGYEIVNFVDDNIQQIRYPEDIFLCNAEQIIFDYDLLTTKRSSVAPSKTNSLIGDQLFVEEGVTMEYCTLNTASGPIYIGKNANIEEGVVLRGPVSIGEGARVKTGAKIYPNTTIGDRSTVAGEVNNTVIWGDSAKGHDGYLGCAVVGQYCNFGAGTNNSNLRNDWKSVTLYSYVTATYRDTKQLKCGLVMGDFSMCAIQTSFTTGTVIGVGVQVAKPGFFSRFVPDFTWLTADKEELYVWDKFVQMLTRRLDNQKGNSIKEEKTLILAAVYQQALEIHQNNQLLKK